jgi:hypothetical protein
MAVNNPGHAGHDPHPYFLLGIAIGCGAFCLVFLLLGLETNEANILHQHVESVVPNFGLLAQVPAIFLGGLDADTQVAALIAWTIVLIYVVCGTCNRFVTQSLGASGKVLGFLMKWVAIPGIFCYDLYTSWNNGPAIFTSKDEWVGHAQFTVLVLFGIMFFGSLSLTLFTHWMKNRTK